jgi:hypothetical protein
MSWAYGVNSKGKEVGYSVAATCEHPGCGAKIDRGLAYACGGTHDEMDYYDNPCCDGYFCEDHLAYPAVEQDATRMCAKCRAALEKGEDDA